MGNCCPQREDSIPLHATTTQAAAAALDPTQLWRGEWCVLEDDVTKRNHSALTFSALGTVVIHTGGIDGYCGKSLRSKAPLPASGRIYVEVVFSHGLQNPDTGTALHPGNMVGLVSHFAATNPSKMQYKDTAHLSSNKHPDFELALMTHGFWGVDNTGDGDLIPERLSWSGKRRVGGIRRGQGQFESAPAESRAAIARRRIGAMDCETSGGEEHIFLNGDRVGLAIDMDLHTLKIYRNGDPVPGLTFQHLPADGSLYLACTLPIGGAAVQMITPIPI